MSGKSDDLEAVRVLADTLQPFAVEDRERIIRWSRERLGMPSAVAAAVPTRVDAAMTEATAEARTPSGQGRQKSDQAQWDCSQIRWLNPLPPGTARDGCVNTVRA